LLVPFRYSLREGNNMSIELPVLRLGLAGFSAQQKAELDAMLQQAAPGRHVWQLARFNDADAWWLNGARTTVVGAGMLRITPAIPSERSLQLNMQEVDRPVGFSVPLPAPPFEAGYSFDPKSLASINTVLEKFEGWLQPVAAQFSLAARIIEQESVLGSGVYHVMLSGRLLATVDMKGDIGVFPGAGPADFDDAMWVRQSAASEIPESFVRSDLSQLMWQYAVRTTRDVLPTRYRCGPLYFRRAPRLPQRMLTDSHLLLIRELASAPGTFVDLQQRTGLGADPLAKVLAALYLVGSITSNAKRASVTKPLVSADESEPSQGLQHSVLPSGMDSDASPLTQPPRRPVAHDFTVPVPIGPR
jgi:hypothetical protein